MRARSLTFRTVVEERREKRREGEIHATERETGTKNEQVLIDSSASSLSADGRPTGTNELGAGVCGRGI